MKNSFLFLVIFISFTSFGNQTDRSYYELPISEILSTLNQSDLDDVKDVNFVGNTGTCFTNKKAGFSERVCSLLTKGTAVLPDGTREEVSLYTHIKSKVSETVITGLLLPSF